MYPKVVLYKRFERELKNKKENINMYTTNTFGMRTVGEDITEEVVNNAVDFCSPVIFKNLKRRVKKGNLVIVKYPVSNKYDYIKAKIEENELEIIEKVMATVFSDLRHIYD